MTQQPPKYMSPDLLKAFSLPFYAFQKQPKKKVQVLYLIFSLKTREKKN